MALHGTGLGGNAAIGLPTRPRPVPGGLTTLGQPVVVRTGVKIELEQQFGIALAIEALWSPLCFDR